MAQEGAPFIRERKRNQPFTYRPDSPAIMPNTTGSLIFPVTSPTAIPKEECFFEDAFTDDCDELMEKPIAVGESRVTVEDVVDVAKGQDTRLLCEPKHMEKILASRGLLLKLMSENCKLYGVTTSYGDSCTVSVSPENCADLTRSLLNSFGCAMGGFFDRESARAILFARLVSLAKGHSGVRPELLQRFVRYLNDDIIPLIPEEGTVGASGDLLPMSYVAATLIGERQVLYKGCVRQVKEVLSEVRLEPLRFEPKECLAIMNGTTVMTALACLAYHKAEYLTRLATKITSICSMALMGNKDHYHPRLFSLKPHKGQNEVAHWIYEDLKHFPLRDKHARLQDRYSLRCAPHVIGVLRDALTWIRRDIENELNSVNDNPVFDSETDSVYNGGHFYGGHIAFAMDSLTNAVASVADLIDRQLALLVDFKFSNGLPPNLTGAEGSDRMAVNLGLKALQISISSYAAEALKLTMPSMSFSRSTECHNQDKVSMGTIAARTAVRVLTLTEQVASGTLMAAVQGLDLRMKSGALSNCQVGPQMMDFFCQFRDNFKRLQEDRPLENDLRNLLAAIQNQYWPLYQ